MTIRNRKPLIALIVAAGSVLAIPAMAQSAKQQAAQAQNEAAQAQQAAAQAGQAADRQPMRPQRPRPRPTAVARPGPASIPMATAPSARPRRR